MTTAGVRSALVALVAVAVLSGCQAGATGSEPSPIEQPAPATASAEQSPPRSAEPTVRPRRTPSPHSEAAVNAAAPPTRILVPSLDIDLPVVSSDVTVVGGTPGYPLCDVAQFQVAYARPGETGTTYMYAHARDGMFLPLLESARRGDGSELIGVEVVVHTADGMAYRYDVTEVVPDATGYELADRARPGIQQLVLQTSTGPRGTQPKVQIGALLTSVDRAPTVEPAAEPNPRACD